MSVNSISPSQTVQPAEAPKKAEVVAARKQSETEEASKVDNRKEAARQKAQVQSTQEPVKPSVNTSGQKTGSIINVAA
ncbi:MAG TPA: hypothetical protein VMV48_01840 [Gallionellaceae bacterium]|nr:hypothetical protein [Gallionellaceae bacterium]